MRNVSNPGWWSRLAVAAALVAGAAACGGGGSSGPPPAATCTDGSRNGGETDVDCGGPSCPRCAADRLCAAATDCLSGLCEGRCVSCGQLEQRMASALDAFADPTLTVPNVTDSAFTLLLQRADGHRFVHRSPHGYSYTDRNGQTVTQGPSTETTSYQSASTSKWVSATVILWLVDQGTTALTLGTTAHALVPGWPDDGVTLAHLLDFTSGYPTEPCTPLLASSPVTACPLTPSAQAVSCLDKPGFDFQDCALAIAGVNPIRTSPGSAFHYASTHLQVAGLLATVAAGKPWSQLFADFQAQTGLFAHSAFDLPSASNPRLAGGMHWTGADYLEFLVALQANLTPKGTALLSKGASGSWERLLADERAGAAVVYSPVWGVGTPPGGGLGEDWSYGFGNWLECPTATTKGGFNCGAAHRNSSPGAYGAYPFIDFDHRYAGLVARQSGTTGTYPEGIAIFRSVQDPTGQTGKPALASQWAASADCGP